MDQSRVWNIVADGRCYGVAKYNFDQSGFLKSSHVIGIHFGETVRIKAESNDWFYVRNNESQEEGIVPKSYIHILECSVTRHGDEEVIIPRWPPVIQEITNVLREWHQLAKKHFLERSELFNNIVCEISILHELRRRIIFPNLTVEERRALKKQVAHLIDEGNHLLKLDMTVRDENGNTLNPSVTSTMELFRQHQKTAQKLKKQGKNSQRRSQTLTHHSQSLLVTIEKLSWRIVDKCELQIFLYDDTSVEQPFITESYICTMKAGDSSKLPLRILFTDLGKKDLDRSKVYLVVFVVRIGAMEFKEPDTRRENTPFSQRSSSQEIRRPWGIATKDISSIFKKIQISNNEHDELVFVPYTPYGDGHESMESTLAKLISSKELGNKDPRIHPGLHCGFSMMTSSPTQHIQDGKPQLIRGNPTITRKMAFPDVILPNDIRNDLYVKLIRGEFHRYPSKTTDKNVEVTVSAHDAQGKLIKGLIVGGSGDVAHDEYKSMVHYHDDKPRWNEIFKISLPISIEEFSSAHLRFTFKHRSSNETKDKSEKPFALCYIPLRNPDGTAISDRKHELVMYKVDPKHYKENDPTYGKKMLGEVPVKSQCPGLSLSTRDYFCIQTTLLSTKFTQNVHLLELLQWSTKLKTLAERNAINYYNGKQMTPDYIGELLKELRQVIEKVPKLVNGEEIVKFLPDIFDALFLILVDPIESIQSEFLRHYTNSALVMESGVTEMCDRAVVECLIYIFGLILDHKYQNFKSVLSLYIEDGFSSALAYKKLIRELQYYIENVENVVQINHVLKIMKSIEYFFKFIVRSYSIRIKLRDIRIGEASDGKEDEIEFERSIEKLFSAMSYLLRKKEGHYLTAQGGCLKHIPSIIPELCTVFSPRKLSELLCELIGVIPVGKLTKQKLTTIKDIVHSPLFLDHACRTWLLPILAQNIQNHLPGNDEDMRRRSQEGAKIQSKAKVLQVLGLEIGESHPARQIPEIPTHTEETEKCVELLSDVMHFLFRKDIGPTQPDISYLMQILLRPIILSIGTIGESDALAGEMVAILLSFFRQMNNYNYSILIHGLKGDPNSVNSKQELLKFLNDVLVVKKNLLSKPYFPLDWTEMILLQNSIVVTTLDHFSGTIKAEYADPFEEQPWINLFKSAVSFLTQKSLQLEEFPLSKSLLIKERYGDMRKRAAELIRVMWFSLGESKRVRFVPMMVGKFLNMALVPEPDLRRTTIPIFFDMLHCEFDRSGNFKTVEDELIKKLVEFIENGKGDREFREIFYDTMTLMCENDNSGLRIPGLSMVHTISRLLDLLLEYREVVNEDDPSNRMTCIVNLLDFSKEIDRKELYIRYLYKLHDLHTFSGNFTEAAFTLELHSKQLDWTDDEIPTHLHCPLHNTVVTQYEQKEALYKDAIRYLIAAKMWECALEVCDELRQQYAEESYNYTQLPILLRQMATFYEEITKPTRINPPYYRVAFYGRGFPSFLQDKSYVYRGKEYERLTDFQARMLERYPHAELLRYLNSPSEDVRNSNKQYMQICSVDPVPNTMNSKRSSAMKNADECVKQYYMSNEIEKFTYSRPYNKEPKDAENEFASRWLDRYMLWTSQSFPGIMSWFPVVRETTTQISPIFQAIETLESTNKILRELIVSNWANPNENLGPLTMKLNGILDAAVQGGIENYEKAFFTQIYLEKNPDDLVQVETLKRVICSQVPILDQGLKIHKIKADKNLMPLHERLEDCFQSFCEKIEKDYAVRVVDLTNDALLRDIERAQKTRQIQINKQEIALSREQNTVTSRNKDVGFRHSSAILARSMGSFSSTMSLYSNAPRLNSAKSTHSVSRYDAFRRSTQGSLSEINEFAMSPNQHHHTSTLPRNGQFFNNASSTSNSHLNVHGDSSSFDNGMKTREGSQASLIPLTEKLTTQRPLRSHEQRKSHNWSTNGDNRNSGISIGSLHNMTATSSSHNSINCVDDDEDAPPLPPKGNANFSKGDGNGTGKVLPPKKPPLLRPP